MDYFARDLFWANLRSCKLKLAESITIEKFRPMVGCFCQAEIFMAYWLVVINRATSYPAKRSLGSCSVSAWAQVRHLGKF